MTELKLSCADFTFPLLPHDRVLDLVAMLGFTGIDIGLFTGRSHITAETEFNNISASANILKKKAADRGLVVTDVYLQLDNNLAKFAINHPEIQKRDYARERFLQFVEYAEATGADHITCLPGMLFADEPAETSIQRCYEELRWRIEKVKPTSLQLSIEAHTGSPFINPANAIALIKAVPGLTLTLDYTHFIRDGFSQQDADALLPYASHFHARGAKKGRLQTSVTENVIDYPTIIQKMKSMDYEGWIGLEYIWIEWEQCNQADTLSETIRLKKIIEDAFNK